MKTHTNLCAQFRLSIHSLSLSHCFLDGLDRLLHLFLKISVFLVFNFLFFFEQSDGEKVPIGATVNREFPSEDSPESSPGSESDKELPPIAAGGTEKRRR